MKQQLERIKERAEWHQSKADDYRDVEEIYGMGAAQYHWEMAQRYWMEYGRLVAQMETAEKWGQEVILLPGRVLL
ncbi:hypothetical protein [Aneurinibacillus thermoaerophilus]|uniref:hypothetical protein n=1 Tax=Aneurinibacillus thermoaerophilus TaxID=143495 RepID=UPI002E1B23AA|nr:hypothetical protein [Aneurinibacillus thermoaerophilus]